MGCCVENSEGYIQKNTEQLSPGGPQCTASTGASYSSGTATAAWPSTSIHRTYAHAIREITRCGIQRQGRYAMPPSALRSSTLVMGYRHRTRRGVCPQVKHSCFCQASRLCRHHGLCLERARRARGPTAEATVESARGRPRQGRAASNRATPTRGAGTAGSRLLPGGLGVAQRQATARRHATSTGS